MPGGYPAGLHRRPGDWGHRLGIDGGTAAETGVEAVLAGNPGRFQRNHMAGAKNFSIFRKFFQKSICICEKKGYNILE
jgi:hypothetical protein